MPEFIYLVILKDLSLVHVCVVRRLLCVQVRAIMTDSAFSIEELEELYVLFKVRTPFLVPAVQCQKNKIKRRKRVLLIF